MTVSSDVQPLGATCLESDRVIYIYLDEPNRPSETLWYRLTGAKPGWKAVIGTQGSYQTWRDVVESEFGLTYSGYEVSTTCIMSSMWFFGRINYEYLEKIFYGVFSFIFFFECFERRMIWKNSDARR